MLQTRNTTSLLLHARPCVSTRGQVNQMCGLPPIIMNMNYELKITSAPNSLSIPVLK